MANSVLTALFANSPFRLTNITKGVRVATSLKIKRVVFYYESRVMYHLREDGKALADARVIVPTRCEVEAYCPTIDAVDQALAILNDRESTYSIQSKGVVLKPAMLENDATVQSPEMLSATPVRLIFKQLLVQGVDPVTVAQSADSRLIDRGIAMIGEARETVVGFASKVRSGMEGLI